MCHQYKFDSSAATGVPPAGWAFHAPAITPLPSPATTASDAQRLQQTLDKLQKPHPEEGKYTQARVWWDALQRNYASRGVRFDLLAVDENALLPKDLFDSAGDNLLQNALRKRSLDETVSINASFHCRETIEFTVCDSGAPVVADVLRGLMRGPVPSETGFGIGLYQTGRLAELSGYSLQLPSNEPGRVCFTLRGEVRSGSRA